MTIKIESFKKQITNAYAKVSKKDQAIAKAVKSRKDALKAAEKVSDTIRGEADKLIVRANQINTMLDGFSANANL